MPRNGPWASCQGPGKRRQRRSTAQGRRRCRGDRDAGDTSRLRYVQFADRDRAGGNPSPARAPAAAGRQRCGRSHSHPARDRWDHGPTPRSARPLGAWIQSGRDAELSEAAELHADIDALEPKIDATADWKTIVLVGLLVRLRELTDLVHDIMALRRQIRAEQSRLAKLAFAQGGPSVPCSIVIT